jgi:hypothetical protein
MGPRAVTEMAQVRNFPVVLEFEFFFQAAASPELFMLICIVI